MKVKGNTVVRIIEILLLKDFIPHQVYCHLYSLTDELPQRSVYVTKQLLFFRRRWGKKENDERNERKMVVSDYIYDS